MSEVLPVSSGSEVAKERLLGIRTSSEVASPPLAVESVHTLEGTESSGASGVRARRHSHHRSKRTSTGSNGGTAEHLMKMADEAVRSQGNSLAFRSSVGESDFQRQEAIRFAEGLRAPADRERALFLAQASKNQHAPALHTEAGGRSAGKDVQRPFKEKDRDATRERDREQRERDVLTELTKGAIAKIPMEDAQTVQKGPDDGARDRKSALGAALDDASELVSAGSDFFFKMPGVALKKSALVTDEGREVVSTFSHSLLRLPGDLVGSATNLAGKSSKLHHRSTKKVLREGDPLLSIPSPPPRPLIISPDRTPDPLSPEERQLIDALDDFDRRGDVRLRHESDDEDHPVGGVAFVMTSVDSVAKRADELEKKFSVLEEGLKSTVEDCSSLRSSVRSEREEMREMHESARETTRDSLKKLTVRMSRLEAMLELADARALRVAYTEKLLVERYDELQQAFEANRNRMREIDIKASEFSAKRSADVRKKWKFLAGVLRFFLTLLALMFSIVMMFGRFFYSLVPSFIKTRLARHVETEGVQMQAQKLWDEAVAASDAVQHVGDDGGDGRTETEEKMEQEKEKEKDKGNEQERSEKGKEKDKGKEKERSERVPTTTLHSTFQSHFASLGDLALRSSSGGSSELW